jgi:hypothetical protein
MFWLLTARLMMRTVNNTSIHGGGNGSADILFKNTMKISSGQSLPI